MEVIAQQLDDILESLQVLTVEWQDDTARGVIQRLQTIPSRRPTLQQMCRRSSMRISTRAF
jgi:hypothetical protein